MVVGPPLAAVDPVAIAAEVLGIVPLPPIRVGANPGVGLVAMPSWFWIDGYDGRRLSGSRAVGLIVVEVEIWPANYHWSFGDGAALDTLSVGRAYPEESDVRHTYEQSSLRAGGTFSTQLEITLRGAVPRERRRMAAAGPGRADVLPRVPRATAAVGAHIEQVASGASDGGHNEATAGKQGAAPEHAGRAARSRCSRPSPAG